MLTTERLAASKPAGFTCKKGAFGALFTGRFMHLVSHSDRHQG